MFDDDFDLDKLGDEETLRKAWQRPLQELFDELFAAEETPISIASLYRLSDMPDEYVAQFSQRWPTLSAERRPIIVRHLADITEENYQVDFSSLCHVFLKDSLAAVRLAALDALWDSSDRTLIQPIIQLMQQDKDDVVRAQAAATLGHYILMAEWKQLPPHTAKPIVAALLEQLSRPDLPLPIWGAALESFAGSGHARVNEFIQRAYEDGDEQLQISAVFAMGRTADKRWLITLQDELHNPDPAMRTQATTAVGLLGSSDPLEQLIELAYEDDDLEVRIAAVAALGQIGGEMATHALNKLAEDPDSEELYETITEALDEMMWLGGEIDFSLIDLDDTDDDDEELP